MKSILTLIRKTLQIPLFIIFISGVVQTNAQDTFYGPENPPPKASSITFTGSANDGQIGFAGGKTFTITNITLANTTSVYWTMMENSIILSMDGPAPYSAAEVLEYSPSLSNLAGGVVVWTGSTLIPISNGSGYTSTPLLSKFVMTVTSSASPFSLLDPVDLNLDAQCGGVALITGFDMVLTIKFEMFVSANGGSTWVPHLEYYNAAATPPEIESAYSEFNFGFYWENDPPEISKNTGATVDEGDTVLINKSMLAASDVESVLEEIIFILDPLGLNELPAHGKILLNDEDVLSQDTLSMLNLKNDKIAYVHDGSESTKDSIAFSVIDDDGKKCIIDGDSVFYFVFAVTPIDDPPSLVNNLGAVLNEDDILVISEEMLLTTDPESQEAAIVYTLDPESTSDFPANGLLKLNGIPLNDGSTFSQADISAGKVTYDHDGSETLTDGFVFEVADEFGHLAMQDENSMFFFSITVNPVNDPPAISKLITLVLDEGGTGTIGNGVLGATDAESPPEDIKFTLDPDSELNEPNYGVVKLNGVELNDGEGFTMADVNNNVVTYTHDGSENHADFFLFTVSDPQGGVASDGPYTKFHFNFSISNVNDAPTVANPIADQETRAEQAYSYTFDANTFADSDEGDQLSYTAILADNSPLPDWLDFDGPSRTFSGTPAITDIGMLDIVVTAMDGSFAEATDQFQLEVTSPVKTEQAETREGIELGPNPFTDRIYFSIKAESPQAVNILIYNMLGEKTEFYPDPDQGEFSVNMQKYPPGIYFIQVEIDETLLVKKLIKR